MGIRKEKKKRAERHILLQLDVGVNLILPDDRPDPDQTLLRIVCVTVSLADSLTLCLFSLGKRMHGPL